MQKRYMQLVWFVFYPYIKRGLKRSDISPFIKYLFVIKALVVRAVHFIEKQEEKQRPAE